MKFIIRLVFILFLSGTLSATTVTIAWDPNAEPDLAGYKVYRSDQPGSYGSPLMSLSTSAMPRYVDSSVQPGRKYYYVVTAFNMFGESMYSMEVTADVPAIVLAPPTGLRATCSANAMSVTISWDSLADSQSYYVRMGNTINGDMPIYIDGHIGVSVSSPIVPGATYDFWIHGFNSSAGTFNSDWGPGIGPSSHLIFSCSPVLPTSDRIRPLARLEK